MRRCVVVAILLVVAPAAASATPSWSLVAPTGWTRTAVGGADENARTWSAPDGTAQLTAGVMTGELDVTVDFLATGETVLRRSIDRERWPMVAELELARSDGRVHVRLLATYDAHAGSVVGWARCEARTPNAACEAALSTFTVYVQRPGRVDDGPLWRAIGLGMAGLVAAIAIGFAIRTLLRRRRAARAVALVDGDLVTLTGVVRPIADASLTAPLSGRACLVHRSRARLFARDGELVDEAIASAAAPFALDTPSGRVIVDDAPRLDVTPQMIAPRHKDRERAFLSAHGRAATDRDAAAFDEIVVAPGDTVVVHGMLKIAVDDASMEERGYRDAPPTVLRLVPPPSGALAIRQRWT